MFQSSHILLIIHICHILSLFTHIWELRTSQIRIHLAQIWSQPARHGLMTLTVHNYTPGSYKSTSNSYHIVDQTTRFSEEKLDESWIPDNQICFAANRATNSIKFINNLSAQDLTGPPNTYHDWSPKTHPENTTELGLGGSWSPIGRAEAKSSRRQYMPIPSVIPDWLRAGFSV